MREKMIWFGEKRGIRFEINRFKSFDVSSFKYGWTFYLWLSPNQFPEHLRGEISTRLYFTAYGTPIEVCDTAIANLDWHGGLTWSSNESKPRYPFQQFKFGCDFQHLWDEGWNYDLADIERAVERCIDSLFVWCPEIKSDAAVWEEFRERFPGKGAVATRFDGDGKPIEEAP